MPRFFSLFVLATLLFSTLFSSPVSAQVRCGDVIRTDAVLTEDLDCRSGWIGLEITGNDVTLDLNGHTLTGSTDIGLMVYGSGVTIRGPGIIKNLDYGIWIDAADDAGVHRVLFDGTQVGLFARGANRVVLSDSTMQRIGQTGLQIASCPGGPSTDHRIENNVIRGRGTGSGAAIMLSGFQVSGARVHDNSLYDFPIGVGLSRGSGQHWIESNWIENVQKEGLWMNGSSGNLVRHNAINLSRGHSLAGIRLAEAAGPFHPACTPPTLPLVASNNYFYRNAVANTDVAVQFGSGETGEARVIANRLVQSKLYDSGVGVLLDTDAHGNQVFDNAFNGTAVPIVDRGRDNIH